MELYRPTKDGVDRAIPPEHYSFKLGNNRTNRIPNIIKHIVESVNSDESGYLMVIAGGFGRHIIKETELYHDIDLWIIAPNLPQAVKCMKKYNEVKNNIDSNTYGYTNNPRSQYAETTVFYDRNKEESYRVQLIHRYFYHSVSDLLNSFDMEQCKVALAPDIYNNSSWELKTSKVAIQSIRDRYIRFANIKNPIFTFGRIVKYTSEYKYVMDALSFAEYWRQTSELKEKTECYNEFIKFIREEQQRKDIPYF